jgi:hypothetical protein
MHTAESIARRSGVLRGGIALVLLTALLAGATNVVLAQPAAAQDASLTTSLSGNSQSGATISAPINTPVTDLATLTGATPDAGGTVTYNVYYDSACVLLAASGGTVSVTNGVVQASSPVSLTSPGDYYWQANYSGDSANPPSTSSCGVGGEVETVTADQEVQAEYTCNVPELVDDHRTLQSMWQVVLSESPSPPTQIAVGGQLETTLSGEITVPPGVSNYDVSEGVTDITTSSASWTIVGLSSGGAPSGAVTPESISPAIELSNDLAPVENASLTDTFTTKPMTWQMGPGIGVVNFTPGDLHFTASYLLGSSSRKASITCTPPTGISPLDSTEVLGSELTLTASPSTLSAAPSPVTYTATVVGDLGGVPTGSVTVADNAGGSCSIDQLSSGIGACAITTETADDSPYVVTAQYSGDAAYQPVSTSITETAVGSVSGKVSDTDGNPVAGAIVSICGTGADSANCWETTTASDGTFSVSNVPDGNYTESVDPQSESLLPESSSTFSVIGTSNTVEDSSLAAPSPPPDDTVVSGVGEAGDNDQIPVVYWTSESPYTTSACSGGTVTVTVTAVNEYTDETETTAPIPLTEDPPGSGAYVGTIPALAPLHGSAFVDQSASNCPVPSDDDDVMYNIYIDPSGTVVDRVDTPIAGALVTLLSSTSLSAPFTPVPNGSAVMSPANRTNPSTTSANGSFGWDSVPGLYEIAASDDGCTVTTPPFRIPPPVEDLELVLDCGQAIKFTSKQPSNAVVGGVKYTPTAVGGGSRNPIVITVASSSQKVCSTSKGVVSFKGVGTCTLDANQAGNSEYQTAQQLQQSFSVRVVAITTASLPSGVPKHAYRTTLTAVGGHPPYSWSKASGQLPPGLSLNSKGIISGTLSKTDKGKYAFTVKVVDTKKNAITKALSIVIS